MNEIELTALVAARQGVIASDVSIEMQGPRNFRAKTPRGSFAYSISGADAPPGEEISLETYNRGGHAERANDWS